MNANRTIGTMPGKADFTNEGKENKSNRKFVALAIILTSIAGAVLLADRIYQFHFDVLLMAIVGGICGLFAAMKR